MEKRVSSRIIASFPVEVKVEETSFNRLINISGETVDLSEDGLGLSLEKRLSRSTRYVIRIDFSPRYPSVEIEAQAIWNVNVAKGDRFRSGVCFLGLQDVNRIEIGRLIRELKAYRLTFWRKSWSQFLATIRDLFIPFLPRFVVRLLLGKGEFVFLAHALDLSDFARKYPFADRMSKRSLKIFSRNLWPIIGSKVTGFRKRDGSAVNGWIVFCPLTTRMMLLKRDLARKKIAKAAQFGEKLGAKVVGLGAFIPILTDDGRFLENRVGVGITTGAAFSAITAVQNVLEIVQLMCIDKARTKIAIVGAAGSVGSICSKMLAKKFRNIMLIDKNVEALYKLVQEINIANVEKKAILLSQRISDIKDMDIIVAVTNVPGVVVRSPHLKSGAIVIDAAQPKNVSTKIPKERNDVLVIESGVIEVDGLETNFDLGLRKRNEVYSCLAEVLLMIWMEQRDNYLGDTSLSYAWKLWQAAENAGIRLADFRNNLGFIGDEEIEIMRKLLTKLGVVNKTEVK